MKKIVLIDNEDSFVYNLADEFSRQQYQVEVFRNNWPLAEALAYIATEKPDALVFSPGPGHPREALLCHSLLDQAPENLPILGVCLGLQCMVEHFDGIVSRCPEICHGKASVISHNNEGLFKGLPQPMQVARYHSLAAEILGPDLEATAHCGDIIMAVQHKTRPLYAVQFHPESVLSPEGSQLIRNFISLVEAK
ncbi:MAG: aminodeoxychorismate/anthranilate synthase component II [Gammaproteobacteria bacterium]|nr:aminodeoxychorismate/anthranilate synthase component II [Gammaproteobacteria bacterium]